MSKQTRKASLAESLMNVAVGYGLFGRYDGHRAAVDVRDLHSTGKQPRHRPDLHRRIDRAKLRAAPVI